MTDLTFWVNLQMNCTPKVRQKKSNFWGVFIMKLTYDDKVQIYELRKQEGEYLKWDVSQKRDLKRGQN